MLRLLAENDRSQSEQLQLLAVAMAYFHGVAQKEITAAVMKSAVASTDNAGDTFTINGGRLLATV
ncbi:hypothetical protein MIZ03_2213 [Rhodoferax lithotrophicus]|uniref:Uncharacterized protein n=1 Tax=Rhodoferax lithotrophicus TaxID=2798804 RepID=A0ABM7MM15_9BURK|nr:hypothetical protein MIZ03_2213 [Rhodoferax sp. MIZ03]